jgi:DDE superfamily endonuclease
MTRRRSCPAAPGPLEGYAARFDDLFTRIAQRRGFREYLAGLLAPRDRNKTLTVLAGAQPVIGAQHPAVQRLQFFLSESPGTRSGSMPAGWSCYGPIRRPRRMMRGCW